MLFFLLCLAGFGGCDRSLPNPSERDLPTLTPGSSIEVETTDLATDRYRLQLAAQEFLHLEVRQQGVDVQVAVWDPQRQPQLVVDGPNGTRSAETVYFLASRTGLHEIAIRPSYGQGGYQVRVVAQRPATEEDRLRAKAAAAMSEGGQLRWREKEEEREEAKRWFHTAAELWRRVGEPGQEAIAWVRLGQMWGNGHRRRQIKCFERALRLLEGGNRPGQRSYALLELGSAVQDGDPESALAAFQEALSLAQETRDRTQEASALNNVALLFQRSGVLERALEFFERATAHYRAVGRLDGVVTAMTNQAMSFVLLGRLAEAREVLMEVLKLHRHLDAEEERARALMELGWIAHLQEDWGQAHQRYEEALVLSRSIGDLWMEGSVLDRRGTLHRKQGRLEKAERDFEAALALFQTLEEPLSVAHTEANLGWLALDRGDLDRAGEFQRSAMEGFQRTADEHGKAAALFLAARTARQGDDLRQALRPMEVLLEGVETRRQATEEDWSRIAFLGLRHEYYEFYIDLLLELAAREPDQGHGAAALEAVERSRSRSLLDDLTEAGAARRPPALGTLPEIRRELLDPDTVLLVYSLGERRSFVWAVTVTSLTFHPLPPAAELEARARILHGALSHHPSESAQLQASVSARRLSEEILQAVTPEVAAARRVVVLPDGGLHLIPFAVLPFPPEGPPLHEEREVVSIPSASVLLALRRQERAPASGIAVLADPPFTVADPRIPVGSAAPTLATGFVDLQRLEHTRQEAAAIQELASGEEPIRIALDLEAQPDLLTGGQLDDYRILHFATHGLLRSDFPELSGLVLSMFDRQGHPQDGTLRVRDVVDLELRADLVVLSACRTALGQRVQGEGVLGFPRAFMLAGVPRVVVSLWKVQDEATAELMEHFYRGMLVDGLPPSRALTQARRRLAADLRWRNPHYWGAFVLQGDWR